MSIVGRSSKFNFGNAESLELDSKRDKFYVDTLYYLSGETDFTYFNAGILKSQLNLNTSFGNLLLQGLSSDFKSINIVSSYTDISLTIPSALSSAVDVTYKKTDLSYPQTLTRLQKDTLNDSLGTYKLKGSIGSDTAVTKNILLNTSGGSFTIITK